MKKGGGPVVEARTRSVPSGALKQVTSKLTGVVAPTDTVASMTAPTVGAH
jgi:hypothetical protein